MYDAQFISRRAKPEISLGAENIEDFSSSLSKKIGELSTEELISLDRDFNLLLRKRVVTTRLDKVLEGLPGLNEMTLLLE